MLQPADLSHSKSATASRPTASSTFARRDDTTAPRAMLDRYRPAPRSSPVDLAGTQFHQIAQIVQLRD